MSMIGCWNVWGLNSLRKQKAVQEWARKDNLDILGIIEPRLGSNKFSEISARMGLQGWLSADNGVDPNKCRILVTWNPAKLMVQILDHAPQWMVCETTLLATNKKLLITFIHGFNTPAERIQLWDHLVGRCSVNTLVPWLAIGDFNAILSGEDRVGGSQSWPQHMEDFPVCIQQAGLSSLPYTGMRFTWSNGQTGANGIQKKLDWALANSALLQAWPAAHANFLPRLVSDHSPMTIKMAQESKARNKPFRFLNLWTDREDFLDKVNGVWNQPVHGNPLYQFTTKIKLMRSTLRRYHNQTSSHISSRVADAKRKWIKGQTELDARPRDPQLQAQERILAENYNRLCKEEEGFFKQRSRIQWLELGDRNTSFFHKSLLHRRSRNKIHSLSTPDGTVLHDQDLIHQHAINYYQALLGSGSSNRSGEEEVDISGMFHNQITEDEQNSMFTGKNLGGLPNSPPRPIYLLASAGNRIGLGSDHRTIKIAGNEEIASLGKEVDKFLFLFPNRQIAVCYL
ncbi:hypothetical protein DKX38_018163 [Salix brachista]|uniref:Endonuclease/exonuclease/phosphatase domain-containing protein n=1 Tax=Salix brachista TaxID=2182728 RepID=A0A5N5KMB6_9ROSI|nr:hypothetical protein DKX38_018163 [Salix brachista]